MGDRDGAARDFENAVRAAPAELTPQRPTATDEPEVYQYAARALQKLGRADEATLIYAGLVECGDAQLADHVPMYFFASFGYPQPEDVRFAQAHYVRGIGLLGLEKRAEANGAFQRAVQLNPNHYAARAQLDMLK